MAFPCTRMQRLRANPTIRRMLSEVKLSKTDFIAPLFIKEGINHPIAIKSMQGVFQHSLNSLTEEAEKIAKSGIPAVLLFGIPAAKDGNGSGADDRNGIVQSAIKILKKEFPHLMVIADCCLCEYTDHGHCGIMENGGLDNDKTLKRLQSIALSYADCGADVIAPSGMMDGMVGAIREVLEAERFPMVSILSYAIKYASGFYGPFREAGGALDVFKGDRKHHQMQPTQFREGMREVELDIGEGADMLMVKPAGFYLDIIRQVSDRFHLPVVAYQVSGEYAMLKAGAAAGAFDESEAFYEAFASMKRAGANLIISYEAVEFVKKL